MQSWFVFHNILGAISFLLFALFAFARLRGRSDRLPFTSVCIALASASMFRAMRASTHSVVAEAMIWVSFLCVVICLVWSAIVMQNSKR